MLDWWEERKKQVEPDGGMVGSLLSGMSPEAKEQYLEDQERIGGPFLRTASEALVGMLEEPISPLGMAGQFRSEIYKTVRDAFAGNPKVKTSDIANLLKRFSMETLDPVTVQTLTPEALQAMKGYDVEGLIYNAEILAPYVRPALEWAKSKKVPISSKPWYDPVFLEGLKGKSTILLSKEAIDPVKTLGHELGHKTRTQVGAKYPDIDYPRNPEEVTAEAIGLLTSGVTRQSTIARLLDRFQLPEETIYDALSQAEMTIQRARGGMKSPHYETLPERKSIERQLEKLGGPRRKNPREGE